MKKDGTFKSSYAKMYMVTPEIYEKLIQCASKRDTSELSTLNRPFLETEVQESSVQTDIPTYKSIETSNVPSVLHKTAQTFTQPYSSVGTDPINPMHSSVGTSPVNPIHSSVGTDPISNPTLSKYTQTKVPKEKLFVSSETQTSYPKQVSQEVQVSPYRPEQLSQEVQAIPKYQETSTQSEDNNSNIALLNEIQFLKNRINQLEQEPPVEFKLKQAGPTKVKKLSNVREKFAPYSKKLKLSERVAQKTQDEEKRKPAKLFPQVDERLFQKERKKIIKEQELDTIMEEDENDYSQMMSCNYCGQLFSDLNNLSAHISDIHKKEAKYSCEICGGVFRLKKQYSEHLRKVHPVKKIMQRKRKNLKDTPVPAKTFISWVKK